MVVCFIGFGLFLLFNGRGKQRAYARCTGAVVVVGAAPPSCAVDVFWFVVCHGCQVLSAKVRLFFHISL